jgi:hypothetical protein
MTHRRTQDRKDTLAMAALSAALALAVTPAWAQPLCSHPELIVVNEAVTIDEDCEINGRIAVGPGGVLLIQNSNLIVRGDIFLFANGQMVVDSSTLAIDNQFNIDNIIDTSGTATLIFSNSELKTNIISGNNFFMGYFGRDDSTLIVSNSFLDVSDSWLISSFKNRSKLMTMGGDHLPSEVVVLNESTATLGPGTDTGLWLPFEPGTKATLHLPDQSSETYSWQFGRDTSQTQGIGYQVNVIDAKVRLHIQSRPYSDVVIFGHGENGPDKGELTVGYYILGTTTPETVSGLRPGYRPFRQLTHQGRNLELWNVKLTPTGWNVYVVNNPALVTVENSIVNEVTSERSGNVEVRNSVVQLSAIASNLGGSSMVIRDSHIFSQLILATGPADIELYDSFIHGSALEAKDGATIFISGGLLLPNGDGDPCNEGNAIDDSGVPRCNPFLENGGLPTITTTGGGQVIFDDGGPSLSVDLHLVAGDGPDPVTEGDTFTYVAAVGNAGPDDATGVRLRFQTPSNAVVDSFPVVCAASGPDVTCDAGNLPAGGATVQYFVSYRALGPAALSSGQVSVSANENDPNPANNNVALSTTVEVDPSLFDIDLQIVGAAGPDPVIVGEFFVHAVKVGNAGPDDATGVNILFQTPPNAVVQNFSPICVPSGTDVSCDVANLAFGADSGQVSVVYQALGPPGLIAGNVTVTGNETETNPTNNSMSFSTTVDPDRSAFNADLQIVGAAGPNPIRAGGLIAYKVQAGNAGPDDATGVKFLFTTPPNVSVKSFPSSCVMLGADVSCSWGDLGFGAATDILTVTYRTLGPAVPITGRVTVTSNETDPTPQNATKEFTITVQP